MMETDIKTLAKDYAAIAGYTSLNWVVTLVAGIGFTLLCMAIALILPDYNSTPAVLGPVHGGGAAVVFFVLTLMWYYKWCTLLVFFCLYCVYFYLHFATLNSIRFAASRIWKKLGEKFVSARLKLYLGKLEALQPDWMKRYTRPANLRAALVKENEASADLNWVEKKLLGFALRKADITAEDLSGDEASLSTALTSRITRYLDGLMQPSWIPFLIHMGIQLALLILAIALT